MLHVRLNTALVVFSAIAWMGLTVLGWVGLGFAGMFVGLGLLLGYVIQGFARRGRVSWRVLAFPVVPWVVLWAAGFGLARYHADVFAGERPGFTIFGLHPSFAWTVLAYWIGGVLTLSVGFVMRRDEWLSEADWEAFRREVGATSGADETETEEAP